MNLANRLTISRIILIPFIMFFMLPVPYAETSAFSGFIISPPGRVIAFVLFIVAAVTDMLDGMIARKLDTVSNFGKLIDPIADKLLVLGVFTAFVQLGRVSPYIVLIIALREFFVTGLRLLAIERGQVIAASWFGKVKTVVQIVALALLLFEPIVIQWIDRTQPFLGYGSPWTIPGDVLIAVAVLLTIFSGIDYWLKNKDLFKQAKASDAHEDAPTA